MMPPFSLSPLPHLAVAMRVCIGEMNPIASSSGPFFAQMSVEQQSIPLLSVAGMEEFATWHKWSG